MTRLDLIALQVMVGAARGLRGDGAVLVRSAHSANIKERRDASTGLFDADGRMVMQAEHILVHLGAMPSAVAAVLDEDQSLGDAWVLNDPYRGGTHLPDITVISPIFAGRAGRLRRQSRPPRRRGRPRAGQHARGLPHPGGRGSRDPAAKARRRRAPGAGRGDAQPAPAGGRPARATRRQPQRRGAVAALADRFGLDTVRAAMDETLDYAERRTRARIAEIDDGEREAGDVLEAAEDDLELRLRATVGGEEITLDFAGSADQYDGNLNCPRRSRSPPATSRCACSPTPTSRRARLPSAHGACAWRLRPAPPRRWRAGTWRPRPAWLTSYSPPSGGSQPGHDEQSSRSATRTSPTTRPGGSQGACPDADGPSAVHVAMSNTLNTPWRRWSSSPARAVEYGCAAAPAAPGATAGATAVRELEALAPMRYSLITERRRHGPPGGGEASPASPVGTC